MQKRRLHTSQASVLVHYRQGVVGRHQQIGSFEIPDRFRLEVRRRVSGADAWLTELPTLWHDLSDQWGLTVTGEPVAGSVSLVVPVRRGNGAARSS